MDVIQTKVDVATPLSGFFYYHVFVVITMVVAIVSLVDAVAETTILFGLFFYYAAVINNKRTIFVKTGKDDQLSFPAFGIQHIYFHTIYKKMMIGE